MEIYFLFFVGTLNSRLLSHSLDKSFSSLRAFVYWAIWADQTGRPGHPSSLIRVFPVCMKKVWVLSYPLSAQQRLWSDCHVVAQFCLFEPSHDKTNKKTCVQRHISLGTLAFKSVSLIRVFAVMGSQGSISSSCWQQTLIRLGGCRSFCWFCHAVAQINKCAHLTFIFTLRLILI